MALGPNRSLCGFVFTSSVASGSGQQCMDAESTPATRFNLKMCQGEKEQKEFSGSWQARRSVDGQTLVSINGVRIKKRELLVVVQS